MFFLECTKRNLYISVENGSYLTVVERAYCTGDRRQGRQRRAIENEPAATTTATANQTNDNPTAHSSGHHMVTRRMARASAGDGDAPD